MYKNLNLFNKPVQRTYHVAGTILYTFKILIYLSSQQLHKLGTYFAHFYYHAHFMYGKTKAERVKQLCQGHSVTI